MKNEVYLEVERKVISEFIEFVVENGLQVVPIGANIEGFDGFIFSGRNGKEDLILTKLLSNLTVMNKELEKRNMKVDFINELLNVYRFYRFSSNN